MKSKTAYWLIALATVLGLIFLVFGVIGTFIQESHVQPQYVLAPIIGGVGLGILIRSGRMDLLFGPVIRKPMTSNIRAGGEAWQARFLGSAFLIGSLAYGFTGEIGYVIGLFGVCVLILRLYGAAQDHLIRKQIEGPNKSRLN